MDFAGFTFHVKEPRPKKVPAPFVRFEPFRGKSLFFDEFADSYCEFVIEQCE
jgi:hypothetical protein